MTGNESLDQKINRTKGILDEYFDLSDAIFDYAYLQNLCKSFKPLSLAETTLATEKLLAQSPNSLLIDLSTVKPSNADFAKFLAHQTLRSESYIRADCLPRSTRLSCDL